MLNLTRFALLHTYEGVNISHDCIRAASKSALLLFHIRPLEKFTTPSPAINVTLLLLQVSRRPRDFSGPPPVFYNQSTGQTPYSSLLKCTLRCTVIYTALRPILLTVL